MNITVNEALKAYIDPLTPDEHEALERSLLTEGCRDALVLWGDTLVDGHNRYAICQKHNLPFKATQSTQFQSIEDVHLWMIDQHLGRRSVSDYQRGVLALRKRAIVAERRAQAMATASSQPNALGSDSSAESPPWDEAQGGHDGQGGQDGQGGSSSAERTGSALPQVDAFKTREDIAKAARLSSSQVVLIEKIQKQATPELVAALKAGVLSINAAAAVASLPAEEQAAAALAGKEELKLAAKRVREAKRTSRETDDTTTEQHPKGMSGNTEGDVTMLQQQVKQLRTENEALRQRVAELEARLGHSA